MSELDNEVVGIGGEIPLQLLEGFLILPFGNELSAVCECGKRTLTLEFPLQPALRQCRAQPSQIPISIARSYGIIGNACRHALGGGDGFSAIGKHQKQHCDQYQRCSELDEQSIGASALDQWEQHAPPWPNKNISHLSKFAANIAIFGQPTPLSS